MNIAPKLKQKLRSCLTLRFNEGITNGIARLFRLPARIPDTDEMRRRVLETLTGVFGLIIWVTVFLLCCALAYVVHPYKPAAAWGIAVAGLPAGFILQYFLCLIYRLCGSLLSRKQVQLSSLLFPRMLGVLSLLYSVYHIAIFCLQGHIGNKVIALCPLVSGGLFFLICFNAELFLVKDSNAKLSIGQELVQYLRFLLHSTILADFIILPLALLLALIGSFLNFLFLPGIDFTLVAWPEGLDFSFVSKLSVNQLNSLTIGDISNIIGNIQHYINDIRTFNYRPYLMAVSPLFASLIHLSWALTLALASLKEVFHYLIAPFGLCLSLCTCSLVLDLLDALLARKND